MKNLGLGHHLSFVLFISLIQPCFTLRAKTKIRPQEKITVATSIPKCGTHLLTLLIHKLTGKRGKRYPHEKPPLYLRHYSNPRLFYYNHFNTTDKIFNFFTQDRFRGIFIHRDPRDALISLINYVKKNKGNGRFDKKYDNMSFDQMFYELVLTGPHNSYYLPDFWRFLFRWDEAPNFITIRFEDLIGPKGGGSYEAQLQVIYRVAAHLDIELKPSEAERIAENLFGNNVSGGELHTFNAGQIGRWKEYFTPERKAFFKEHYDQLLIDLGYENDDTW